MSRQVVVTEAFSWLGTPWHHAARSKGSGVDCGMFLLAVFESCGLLPHIEPPYYAQDFMLHNDGEWFLNTIRAHADEIRPVDTLPGDVLIFRHGRIYSHGAIVVKWPQIIHASLPAHCVCLDDMTKAVLKAKPVLAFSPRCFV